MKTAFILAAGLLATSVAIADEEVTRRVDASPDGVVTISNTAGSIEVRGWRRNEVEVQAELGKDVEELIVERDDDEVIVKVKLSKGRHDKKRHWGGNSSTDLIVNVPERSEIHVTGVSADIDVEGVLGAQRLSAVSGDIETEAHSADIEIEAVSGDVSVEGNREDMRLRATSVSGDLEISGIAGELLASSVSGDVVIGSSSVSRADLNTTNGDMTFNAELRDNGRMEVETINGDVDIEFQGKLSARFDIETFNGSVNNCFGPQPERTSRYAPGIELIFAEGGGSGRVTIRTLNGDLRMCRD